MTRLYCQREVIHRRHDAYGLPQESSLNRTTLKPVRNEIETFAAKECRYTLLDPGYESGTLNIRIRGSMLDVNVVKKRSWKAL
jgi:hypothetical protein